MNSITILRRKAIQVAVICALLLGVIAPSLAEEFAYTDTSGQLSAVVPEGWTNESTPDYGLFTNAGVTLYIITFDGTDLQSHIATAVATYAPEFTDVPPASLNVYPFIGSPWEQTVLVTEEGAIAFVLSVANNDLTAILILMSDDVMSLQALDADFGLIFSSLQVAGVEVSEASAVLASNVPLAEGVVSFPTLTGQYAVGRIEMLWTDESREETYTAEVDPRVVTVWVWYPASVSSDAQPAPYLSTGMSELFLQQYGVSSDNVAIHSLASPRVQASESGYPVVIFSHGNGMNGAFYASILEEIASHGYIVFSIDHTYNALLTILPDGRVVSSAETPAAGDQSDDDLAVRVADVGFVLDQLEHINSQHDLLQGLLDLSRIGLFGHSYGGATIAEACRVESTRCKSAIVLDMTLLGEVAEVGLSQPILMLDAEVLSGEEWVEESETVTGQQIPGGYEELIDESNAQRNVVTDMLMSTSSAVYRLEIEGTRHNSYTDIPLLAEVQPLLQGQLGLASITVERGQQVISEYVVAFLDMTLKNIPTSLFDGVSPAYPEVSFYGQ